MSSSYEDEKSDGLVVKLHNVNICTDVSVSIKEGIVETGPFFQERGLYLVGIGIADFQFSGLITMHKRNEGEALGK